MRSQADSGSSAAGTSATVADARKIPAEIIRHDTAGLHRAELLLDEILATTAAR